MKLTEHEAMFLMGALHLTKTLLDADYGRAIGFSMQPQGADFNEISRLVALLDAKDLFCSFAKMTGNPCPYHHGIIPPTEIPEPRFMEDFMESDTAKQSMVSITQKLMSIMDKNHPDMPDQFFGQVPQDPNLN